MSTATMYETFMALIPEDLREEARGLTDEIRLLILPVADVSKRGADLRVRIEQVVSDQVAEARFAFMDAIGEPDEGAWDDVENGVSGFLRVLAGGWALWEALHDLGLPAAEAIKLSVE